MRRLADAVAVSLKGIRAHKKWRRYVATVLSFSCDFNAHARACGGLSDSPIDKVTAPNCDLGCMNETERTMLYDLPRGILYFVFPDSRSTARSR